MHENSLILSIDDRGAPRIMIRGFIPGSFLPLPTAAALGCSLRPSGMRQAGISTPAGSFGRACFKTVMKDRL